MNQLANATLGYEVPAWRIHDLRRTVATNLQRLGVRLEVTEAILNHVSGSKAGIVGVYQRYDWATEKRVALESWSTALMGLITSAIDEPNAGAVSRSNAGTTTIT